MALGRRAGRRAARVGSRPLDPGGPVAPPAGLRRYAAPVLITLVLLASHLSFGILEGYDKILLSVGVAMATEAVLSRFLRGVWPNVASAYISGISLGILIRSALHWPYAVGAALSIASKYVLRFRGRHLWNPSNFGICVLFFLAAWAVAPLTVQWGNAVWPMVAIWVIGSITIWRVGRFHICAAYVLTFLALAPARAWITGDPVIAEVAPITGPMYQLFVFFMITDPKTTVSTTRGRVVVAVLIGLVEAGLRLGEVVYAPFYALFVVGPAALALELWRKGRSEATSSRPPRFADTPG